MISIIFCYGTALGQSVEKIGMNDLPTTAHAQLHGKYAKFHINQIEKVLSQDGTVTYKVEVQKKSRLVTLVYSEKGELLETKKSKVFTYDGTEPVKNQTGGSGGHSGHNHVH